MLITKIMLKIFLKISKIPMEILWLMWMHLEVSEEVLQRKFFQLLDIVLFQLSPVETKD